MRILFLNKYQNKVYRGAETFVYELAKRLSKNHEVDVVIEINYFDILKKKYGVIIPTNGRMQAVIVRIVGWLSGSRVFISGQSGIGLDDRINLYTFPNIFVALSSKALNWAKKINPLVKSVYVPNGVDLEKFSFKGQAFKARLSKPIILSVGAFTTQKRLDLVIKAVAKLDGVSLLVAGGGGELKDELQALGTRLLGNRFEMVSVPFEKMPEVYRTANVFTLPSASSESFGNVLVEAMASGLPVVATSDPIRKEIVGDAGILIDPTNIEEYSQSLKNALEANWGDRPRKQAEKFSWDEIAKKYEGLLSELIK